MTEQIINGIPVIWEQDRVGEPGSYQMTPQERAEFESDKALNFEKLQNQMEAIERRATDLMPFSRPTPPGGLIPPTQTGMAPSMADNARRKFEARQRYDMLVAGGASPKEALSVAMQSMWQKPMSAGEQARIEMQRRALALRERMANQPKPVKPVAPKIHFGPLGQVLQVDENGVVKELNPPRVVPERVRKPTYSMKDEETGMSITGTADTPEIAAALKAIADKKAALEAKKNAPSLMNRISNVFKGTPTQPTQSAVKEVVRMVNGKRAIFDANTKQFLRYAD